LHAQCELRVGQGQPRPKPGGVLGVIVRHFQQGLVLHFGVRRGVKGIPGRLLVSLRARLPDGIGRESDQPGDDHEPDGLGMRRQALPRVFQPIG
jgi:hypothetical protein